MTLSLKKHYRLYCGIDISKKRCDVAVISTGEQTIQPFTVANDDKGFKTVCKRLEKKGIEPDDILVVLEPTGTYWLPIARHLFRAGYHVVAINPLTARRHITATLERNKTDKIDAMHLAEIAMLVYPDLKRWHEPPLIYEELRQRIELRDALKEFHKKQVKRHKAIQGRLLLEDVDKQRQDVIDYLDDRVTDLEEQMGNILLTDPEWGQTARYILSIPGLAIYTVSSLMMYTQNFTVIDTVDQLVSFVGVAPIKYESGETSYSYIGYSSVPRLRDTLYMCTLSAVRFNPVVDKYYNRLVAKPLHPQKARLACVRKLLKLAWGCAMNQQMFDPTFHDNRKKLQSTGD